MIINLFYILLTIKLISLLVKTFTLTTIAASVGLSKTVKDSWWSRIYLVLSNRFTYLFVLLFGTFLLIYRLSKLLDIWYVKSIGSSTSISSDLLILILISFLIFLRIKKIYVLLKKIKSLYLCHWHKGATAIIASAPLLHIPTQSKILDGVLEHNSDPFGTGRFSTLLKFSVRHSKIIDINNEINEARTSFIYSELPISPPQARLYCIAKILMSSSSDPMNGQGSNSETALELLHHLKGQYWAGNDDAIEARKISVEDFLLIEKHMDDLDTLYETYDFVAKRFVDSSYINIGRTVGNTMYQLMLAMVGI